MYRGKYHQRKPEPAGDYNTLPCYTAEQSAWLTAILARRTKLGRVPTFAEAFRLALELGYRKDEPDETHEQA